MINSPSLNDLHEQITQFEYTVNKTLVTQILKTHTVNEILLHTDNNANFYNI